ncbi:hypothetical protein HDU87_005084 [Geranomyces variabilis]|uniref:Extracellular membrane protein CFEM domain-containing protein n=1 Tax=Geranomyces variabilis TaxID=109894 RepID=A0AAD5XQT3_9FUNG|nr:hypothetical protein HDU87_005084 [Geranomyces variabilis]
MYVKLLSLLALSAFAVAAPAQSATGVPEASCRRGVSTKMPVISASGPTVTPGSCAVACKSFPFYAISQVNGRAACRCASDDDNGKPIAAAACEATKCSDGSLCGDAQDVHVLAYYKNLPAYIKCVDSTDGSLPAIQTPRSVVTPLSCAATCSAFPYFVISQSSVLNPQRTRESVCRCAKAVDYLSPLLANDACAASKCVDGSSCGDSQSEAVAAIYRNFAGPVKCVESAPGDVPAIVFSGPTVTPLTCAAACKDLPYFAIGQSDSGLACRCARDTNVAPATNQFYCAATTCIDGSSCGSADDQKVLAYYNTKLF